MSGAEGDFEIYEEISGHCYKPSNDGRGQQPWPTRTIVLPNRRQNLCLSPIRNDPGDSTMPPLQTDGERLCGRRGSVTEKYSGTGSQNPHINTTTVSQE